MLGIQLLGLLFGFLMIYFSFLHYKRREFSGMEFMLWIVFWVMIILVALFPNGLDFIVKNVLSLKGPLDFFIICGFLFLIFISFHNYSLARKNERRLQRLVSELALRNAEKEDHQEIHQKIKNEEKRKKR